MVTRSTACMDKCKFACTTWTTVCTLYNRLYGYVYDRVYENVYYRVHRCETSLKDWPGHDKKVARATVAISLRIAALAAEIPILFSGTVISCWVPQFLPTAILCQQNKYRGGTSDATFLSALIYHYYHHRCCCCCCCWSFEVFPTSKTAIFVVRK